MGCLPTCSPVSAAADMQDPSLTETRERGEGPGGSWLGLRNPPETGVVGVQCSYYSLRQVAAFIGAGEWRLSRLANRTAYERTVKSLQQWTSPTYAGRDCRPLVLGEPRVACFSPHVSERLRYRFLAWLVGSARPR